MDNYKVNFDPQIPQSLIDECEKLSIENGETMFIFCDHLNRTIKSKMGLTKEDERDQTIDILLENVDDYKIDTVLGFQLLPSRFAYYDTEIKLTNRYERYQFVINYILKLGFKPSINNFGPEYEQSFNLELCNKIMTLRLSPNLFMSSVNTTTNGKGSTYMLAHPVIYNNKCFFSKKELFEWMRQFDKEYFKVTVRDNIIDEIFS